MTSDDTTPDLASDPAATTDAPRWYVLASLAWLRIVRCALWCRALSPHRALLLTAPWSQAAALAGMELPARFYQVATEAGIWPEQAR